MKVGSSELCGCIYQTSKRQILTRFLVIYVCHLAKESIKTRNSSDINDHCVLWSLFTSSEKRFDFMKGADKIFAASSLVLISK